MINIMYVCIVQMYCLLCAIKADRIYTVPYFIANLHGSDYICHGGHFPISAKHITRHTAKSCNGHVILLYIIIYYNYYCTCGNAFGSLLVWVHYSRIGSG